MARSTTPNSGHVFDALGILEPDVELAKADLVVRVHRLAQRRRLGPDEAAALLGVPKAELPALFQGRLATCSIDQLLRILTWLGDDVEILIRPRLQRTKRGALRVLEAAAVERPDDFEPARGERGKRSLPEVTTGWGSSKQMTVVESSKTEQQDERQLLNKHALEKMTSLDITTIYRKIAGGTFPQPVRIGRRRVAWRTSDIIQWQRDLAVGTETQRWKTGESPHGDTRNGRRRHRSDD